jgi:hypothetical protein
MSIGTEGDQQVDILGITAEEIVRTASEAERGVRTQPGRRYRRAQRTNDNC